MEEKILEIIKRERSYMATDACLVSANDLAFEITAYIKGNYYEKEFIEWYSFSDMRFFPQEDDEGKNIFYDYNNDKNISLNELYQYWLNNIEK